MTTRLTCAAKTDVGLKRTNNEDNLIMVPGQGLYVLADGMGGHASGQVASTMCVSHVAKFICEIAKKPGFVFPYPKNPKISYEANLLANAIKYANERIYIQSCKDRAMEGMGTTVTAIFNAPHGLVLAHVGDSRIYRIRKGQITQMSRDHSLLNHLIDKGELKPEDAKHFAQKNVILRAVGLKENVEVDIKEVPREQGDVYLMCSDGLSDLVPAPVIAKTVSSASSLTEACNILIGLALKAGGKDNVTVVCVEVEVEDGIQAQPVSRPGMTESSPGYPKQVITSVPDIPPAPGNMGRSPAKSYPGMQAVGNLLTPPSQNSVRQGMAPLPGTRSSVPNMPPVSEQSTSNAPETPVRMHSVREIVQSRSEHKHHQVQTKPRSSSTAMPAIPSKGKVKAIVKEDKQTEMERLVQVKGSSPSEHISSNKATRPELPKHNVSKLPGLSKSSHKKQAEPTIKEVSSKPAEKSGLPDTKLLFTQPPVSAKSESSKPSAPQSSPSIPRVGAFPPPPEFVPEYVMEDDSDEENAPTMLECPVFNTNTQPPEKPSVPSIPAIRSLNTAPSDGSTAEGKAYPSTPGIAPIKSKPQLPPTPSGIMPAISANQGLKPNSKPALPPTPSSIMPIVTGSSTQMPATKPEIPIPTQSGIMPAVSPGLTSEPDTNPELPTADFKPAPGKPAFTPSQTGLPPVKPAMVQPKPPKPVLPPPPDFLNSSDTPTIENAPDYQTAKKIMAQQQPRLPSKPAIPKVISEDSKTAELIPPPILASKNNHESGLNNKASRPGPKTESKLPSIKKKW